MARRKSRRAEDTSDLNSDVDVVKRKIRPARISSSDSETEISQKSQLPKPPKLSVKETVQESKKQTGKKATIQLFFIWRKSVLRLKCF